MKDIVTILPIVGILLGIVVLFLLPMIKNNVISGIAFFIGNFLVIVCPTLLLGKTSNNPVLVYYCGVSVGEILFIFDIILFDYWQRRK